MNTSRFLNSWFWGFQFTQQWECAFRWEPNFVVWRTHETHEKWYPTNNSTFTLFDSIWNLFCYVSCETGVIQNSVQLSSTIHSKEMSPMLVLWNFQADANSDGFFYFCNGVADEKWFKRVIKGTKVLAEIKRK